MTDLPRSKPILPDGLQYQSYQQPNQNIGTDKYNELWKELVYDSYINRRLNDAEIWEETQPNISFTTSEMLTINQRAHMRWMLKSAKAYMNKCIKKNKNRTEKGLNQSSADFQEDFKDYPEKGK